MKATFKKTVLIASIIATMTGCVHTKEHKRVSEETIQPLKMLDQISEAYKNAEKAKKSKTYLKYKVAEEQGDLDSPLLQKVKPVTMDITTDLNSVIQKLAGRIGSSVIFQIENEDTLKQEVNIIAKKMKIKDFIRVIERVGNIDIYFNNQNTMIISDRLTLSGEFIKLEQTEGVYDNIKKNLEEILGENSLANSVEQVTEVPPAPVSQSADPLGLNVDAAPVTNTTQQVRERASLNDIEPKILIDKATGAFWISASPNEIRRSKLMLESLINTSLSHANVNLSIYRINNERAKQVGISVNKVVDNLYQLAAGASADGIIEKSFNFAYSRTDSNSDILSAGLSLYEKNGIIKTESSNVMTVFNNVVTTMSDTQTVGNWIPGDLRQENTVLNGVSQVTFTEDKPEFIEDTVGKTLVFKPRIDIENKIINMEIDYSESSIYKTETFTWKRNTNIGDVVEITKPLKTENKVKATLVVNGAQYTVMAGMKSKTGSIQRRVVPGFGDLPIAQDIGSNASDSDLSDALFVVKAEFPEKPEVKTIKKVRLVD